MPRDDREQNFDQALAHSLRASGDSHGNDANGASDCLDAETLAAYHERLLDPEEMAQRKTHIASCERCQEILAQLEATDAIPVEADRELLLDQIVLDIPETEPAVAISEGAPEPSPQPPPKEAEPVMAATPPAETPSQHQRETQQELGIEHEPDLVAASAALPSSDQSHAVISAAPTPAAAVAVAAKSAPSSATITFRAPREDRPKMIRFVALAGAIAAGLIFWLVYRDQTKPIDVAQNFPAKKLELPPESPAPPQSVESAEAERDARSQSSEPKAATSPNAAAPAPAQTQPSASKSPTDNVTNSLDDAKKTIDSAKALQQKQRAVAGDLTTGTGGNANITNPSARAETPKNSLYALRDGSNAQSQRSARKVEAPSLASSAAAPPAAANAAPQFAANSPSGIPATPPPARTKMNPGVITEAVTVSPMTTPVAEVSGAPSDTLSKPANGRISAAVTPLSVPAPDGTTIWRIGQAGMIQRSTDSGSTWSIQPSGVVSDLIAGSAYSGQVCWLVGRNGTILRTINGGATWQKLASPSNVDLLSIFSINADSATITDAAGRAFETTSAGAHWTRTRLQQ